MVKTLFGMMILSTCCFWQGCCREGADSSSQELSRQTERAKATTEKATNPAKGDLRSGGDHYGQANYLKGGHESEEALKEFNLAIENGYDTVDLRIDLGELLWDQLNRKEEALEQFRIAAQRDQSHFRAHSRLAQSLLVTRQYDEALRELEIVRRLDPDQDAEGFYSYETATALDGLERYDEALKEYEIFLLHFGKISPKDPDVLKARERIRAIKEQLNRN